MEKQSHIERSKNMTLKVLLEDYGLAYSIKEGSYIKGKVKYWFKIKTFDPENDQLWMQRAQTNDRYFFVFLFLMSQYSIITNMNEGDLGMFQVRINELYTNPDKRK